MTISISDANRKPTFDDGDSATREVAENAAAVVDVGSPVAATDADNGDTLTYTLDGDDAASFTIVGTTGQIKTRTSLDHEAKDSYSVTVKVTDSKDGAGGTSTAIDDEISVTINVTDVNEAPTATDDSVTINEDAAKTEIAVTANDTDPEGASLAASIVTSPTLGTAAVKSGSSTVIEYTPNANANGSDSFTYKVSDGTHDSSTATVSITINAVNDDPVAVDDAKTIVEDSAKTEINVVANDTDIDSTSLSVSAITTAPTKGTATVKATDAKVIEYTPNADANGRDTIVYTVSDGSGGTDSGTLTITITAVNDDPVFSDGDTAKRSVTLAGSTANSNVGSPLAVTHPDTGDTLTFGIGGTDGSKFTISNTGQISVGSSNLPVATQQTYTVTVTVRDSKNSSGTADTVTDDTITVTITISDANSKPTFDDGDSTTREVAENAAAVTNVGAAVAATDADNGDTLTYTLAGTDAASFTIVGTTGQIKTRTSLDHETKDSYSVTVKVTDGKDGTGAASTAIDDEIPVTINVTDVNEAPTATDDSVTINEDAAKTEIAVTANDTDPEGASLTASIVTNPTLGTAALKSGSSTVIEYTPNANANGEDSFTYKVSDGTHDSGTATVSITINADNDDPVATDDAKTIVEDSAKTEINVIANDTDIDSTSLSVSAITTSPTKGTAAIKATDSKVIEYTPHANANGRDTIVYTVSDGSGGTDSGTLTITITAVNDDPVFSDGATATRSVTLAGSTKNSDVGAVLAVTHPSNEDETLTFGIGGTDASKFTVDSDGQISVGSTDLPVATQQSYEVTVTVSDGKDSTGDETEATTDDTITVTITISGTNRAPTFDDGESATREVAENAAAVTNVGSPVAATDADRDTLTYTLAGTDAASFTIVETTGQIKTRTSLDRESKSSYSVTVKVTDKKNAAGGSDTEIDDEISVTINVTDVNEAPTATDDSVTVSEDSGKVGIAVTANDTDPEGGTLTASIVTNPDKGTAAVKTGDATVIEYTPNANANGGDSFTYKVNDGTHDSGTATVSITINAVNDNPVAVDDAKTIVEDSAKVEVNVIANDTDIDSTSLSVSAITTAPTKGTASVKATDAKVIEYTPNADAVGRDTIVYTVSDGSGGTDSGTLTITITAVNDDPAFSEGTVSDGVRSTTRSVTLAGSTMNSAVGAVLAVTHPTDEAESLAFGIGGTDGSKFVVSSSGQISIGSTDLPVATQQSYEVTVTVSDGKDSTGDETEATTDDTITVTITISDANSKPAFDDGDSATREVAENAAAVTNVGAPVAATDADSNDTLTYTLAGTDAASFTIVGSTGQIKTRTSLDHESKSSYSVTVKVTDGKDGTGAASTAIDDEIPVTINVTDVNEAPTATDDVKTIDEDSGKTEINVTSNDTDPEGASLTASIVTNPTLGTAALKSGSSTVIEYTPNANANGEDSFTYKVSDGTHDSGTATVTVTINAVNDAPVAVDDAKTIVEDSAKVEVNVVANDTDVDSTSLSVSAITTAPTKGTATIKATDSKVIEYTPNADAVGRDTIVYTVSDGTDTASGTLTITITAVNDDPAFSEGTVTDGVRATTRSVTLAGSTKNSDVGAVLAVTHPTDEAESLAFGIGGTDGSKFVVSSSGQISIGSTDLPVATQQSYEVTVTVSDGKDSTGDETEATTDDTITVTITISGTNSKPTFDDGTSTTREVAENSAAVTNVGSPVAATDADNGDTLTYTMTGTDAASFTIVGSTGQIKTRTSLDHESKSSYSVTVKVTDGKDGTGAASTAIDDEISVTINVTDVNEAPTATDDSATIDEDSGKTEIAVTSNDTDPEGASLTASIVTNPTLGTAALKSGSSTVIEYTPNANANGEDSFTYKVNDGTHDSSAATVTITINSLNDDPVATDDAKTINEDSAKTEINVIANDTDIDGDDLTVTAITTAPTKGTAAIKTGNKVIEYTPKADANGRDTIVYTVSDGTGTDSGTLTITITAVNDDPTFTEGTVTDGVRSTTRSVTLAGSTKNSDVGAVLAVTHPTDEAESLTFAIGGTDGSKFVVSSSGQISVGSTDLPVATQQSYEVTVTVRDSKNSSGTADTTTDDTITVTISISDANSKPTFDDGESATREVAENAAAVTNVGSPVAATDADNGDTLTYTLDGTDKSSFTIVGTTGQIKTKTSLDHESKSSYSVTVKVTDSKNVSGAASTAIDDEIPVTINVTDVNEAPTATDDSKTIDEDSGKTEIAVTSNDTDPEGASLTASIVTNPTLGTAALKSGSSTVIEYTPNANANGEDSFTYKVNDGTHDSSAATVTITINAVNDNPAFDEGTVTNEVRATTRSITPAAATANAKVGSPLAVTHPDTGDTLTYTIGGTDGSKFVVSSSGQISVGSNALPVDTQQSYTVTVTVSDGIDADGDDEQTPTTDDTITVTINITTGPAITVFLKSDTSTEVTSLTKSGSYTFTVKGTGWTSDLVGGLGVLLTACLVPVGDADLSLLSDCDSDGLATTIGLTVRTGSQDLTTMYGTESDALALLRLTLPSLVWPTFTVASDGSFTQDMTIAVPVGGTIITAVTGPFDANKLLAGTVDLTSTTKHTVAVDSIAGLSAAATTSSVKLTWTNASFCTSTAPACSYWVRHKKSAAADSEWSSWANTGWTSGAPAHTVSSLDENTSYDFELQRREGTGNSQVTVNEGSVTASTDASNRKPTFDDGMTATRSVAENSPMSTNVGSPVAASDSDSGDTLTYSMTGTDASSFTIDTSTGQIRTSAALDHETKDSYSVTVKVTDGKNAAGAADTDTDDTITVTINVTDVNEAPTATNDAKTINEDSGKTEINVIANDTDPEDDTLSAVIATNPTKGTAALKSGSTTVIEYTPNANAFGKDSFTYKASDGTLQSAAATVTITITGINDKPVAVADSKTISEDSGKVEIDVTANDTDADNDTLTASIVTSPQKGTAAVKTGDAGVIEYTPNANANGSDSFTYKVNDGTVDSDTATVSITINAVNDPPVANDDAKTINEDSGKTEINVIANDTDVDSTTLSVTAITTAPTKGTAAIKSGSTTVIEYTPKADAFGKDSLVYTVSDGSATDSGTLKITITGINDKPVAVADSKTINEDSAKVEINVTANDTDADGDTLTASIVTSPQKGTAAVKSGDAGVIEYTPNANANGSDSFTYKVNDGTVDSTAVTVSITINAVNDAPVGVADSKTINEDSAKVEINVIANDTDVEGDTLSVTAITTSPTKGTAAIKTGNKVIEYTPKANANGRDTIVYTVSDGTDTASGTLTITITAVNDDPVFSDGATARRAV